MFSQTADYALRAIVHLAKYPDEPMTAQDIASATRVSHGYLSKVMQSLVRAGVVSSQRGLHGGFRIAKDVATLTILEAIDAVDPIERILVCPLGLGTHGAELCALHRKLDDTVRLIRESLGSTTVADLFADRATTPMLCEERPSEE